MSYNYYAETYVLVYWVIVAVVVIVIPLIGGIGILCAYYCCCRETCRPQLGSNLFGRSPQAAAARTVANPNYAGSHTQVFVTQQYPQQQYPGQVQYPQQYPQQQLQQYPQQYPQQQPQQQPQPPGYSEK